MHPNKLVISQRLAKAFEQYVRGLGKVQPLDWYNPSFEQLKIDRRNGNIFVFNGGSEHTIFDTEYDAQRWTKMYYRVWHDSMHIKHELDFSQDSERRLASILYHEVFKLLGVGYTDLSAQYDANLIKTDLLLHIAHYHKHKLHPDNQRAMLQHFFVTRDLIQTLSTVW